MRTKRIPYSLDVFFKSTEMDIQLMEMLQQSAQRRACCHFGEGIDILGETLATITELAIRSGNVGVGVVNVA